MLTSISFRSIDPQNTIKGTHMKEKAITRETARSTTTVHEIEQTSSELYKVGMITTAAFAAIIGVWGVVCLSSAFISTGGPVALVKSLFGALTGTM